VTTLACRAAIVIVALAACASGCGARRAQRTPEGDTVLVRRGVRLHVATRDFTIIKSIAGGAVTDPFVFASSPTTGATLSASLQAAEGGDCREAYWRKLQQMPGFVPEEVTRHARGQFLVVEYLLRESPDPRFGGVRVDQRNAVGCVTRGATTAIVHVAKVRYTERDAALLSVPFHRARVAEE
jgi:hypothetical protein